MKKVIEFLGEQGIDSAVIRMIESQCPKGQSTEKGEIRKEAPEKMAQKKQPESNARKPVSLEHKKRRAGIPKRLPGPKRMFPRINHRLPQRKIRLL